MQVTEQPPDTEILLDDIYAMTEERANDICDAAVLTFINGSDDNKRRAFKTPEERQKIFDKSDKYIASFDPAKGQSKTVISFWKDGELVGIQDRPCSGRNYWTPVVILVLILIVATGVGALIEALAL